MKPSRTSSLDSVWYTCIGILIIIIDQAIKNFFILSKEAYIGDQYVEFIPVLNTGLSFSFFSSYEYSNYFIALSAIACIIIFIIYAKLQHKEGKYIFAETFVIAASLSNIIDRIFQGGVIDYLRINIIRHINMPIGNVADIIILLGLGYIFINLFQEELQT